MVNCHRTWFPESAGVRIADTSLQPTYNNKGGKGNRWRDSDVHHVTDLIPLVGLPGVPTGEKMLGSGEGECRSSPEWSWEVQLSQGTWSREVGTASDRKAMRWNPVCPQSAEHCNKLKALDSMKIQGEFAGCTVSFGNGCSHYFYGWISVKLLKTKGTFLISRDKRKRGRSFLHQPFLSRPDLSQCLRYLRSYIHSAITLCFSAMLSLSEL